MANTGTIRRSTIAAFLRDIQKISCSSAPGRIARSSDARSAQDSIEHLTTSNLGFVIKVALQFRASGQPLDDLVGAASLGLVQAAHRFDGNCGARFTTYAVWWIRKALFASLERAEVVRLPPYQRRKQQDEERRDPARVDRRRTRAAPRLRVVSLDDQVGGDDGRPLGDQLADVSAADPEAQVLAGEQSRLLQRALLLLDERERFLVRSRFGFGGAPCLTLHQIGQRLGFSRERARQLEAQILTKLRRRLAPALRKTALRAAAPRPHEALPEGASGWTAPTERPLLPPVTGFRAPSTTGASTKA